MRTAAHPDEPLVIPAGMRLSSVATPGVAAQAFETAAAATFSGVSSVPVTLPGDDTLKTDEQGRPQWVLVAGQVSGVRPGDRLLLAEKGFTGADDHWSLVTVGTLTPQPDPGTGAINTRVTFSDGDWGPTPPPAPPPAHVSGPPVRRPTGPPVRLPALTSAVASGPGTTAQATGYRLMRPSATAALWTNQTVAGDQVVEAAGAGLVVHLSAAVRAISPGDTVLFDGGTGASALAVVASVSDLFLAVPYPPGFSSPANPLNPPDIAVAHTQLTLTLADEDAAVLNAAQNGGSLGSVTVRYGFRDVGQIIPAPAPSLNALPAAPVTVPASYTPPAGGTIAFLTGATGAGILVTVNGAGQGQVTLGGAGSPPAAITTPLPAPLQLLLGLVPVSRGTSVPGEVLGSGNATLINQSFTLAKSPLTYLASGGGPVAALAVYVDGVEWTQVPSFYGQAADATVYVVSRSPDQSVTTVTFGDGVNGARLTSGTGNVVAAYRYGSGAASPPAGRLTTISQPQPNLASIQNPVAVSGGADPQGPDDVRANAPASVFTFGRAISALDYEVVAAQAPGVARVAASWTFDGTQQRPLVTVYVGDDQAAAAAAAAALAGADDPNRPVSVLAATAVTLRLSCTLVVAADRQAATVTTAVTAALSDPASGLFSPAQMRIGQRLYRSAVDAALMQPGVTAVRDLTVAETVPLPLRGPVGPFVPVPGGLVPTRPVSVRLVSVGLVPRGQLLGEFLDPGAGAFFELPPGSISITVVSAGG